MPSSFPNLLIALRSSLELRAGDEMIQHIRLLTETIQHKRLVGHCSASGHGRSTVSKSDAAHIEVLDCVQKCPLRRDS